MSDPMKKVMKLFLCLAEDDKTIEEVLPLADRLFHDECRMQIDGQCLNKTRIMADMKAIVTNKINMELSKVEQDELGIVYEYVVHKPRERDTKMVAKAMVRDGKIYHVDISNAADISHDSPHLRRATAPVIHGF